MYEAFEPKDKISTTNDTSMWCALPYENGKFSGRCVTSLKTPSPVELVCDPKLEGWYKIFICYPGMVQSRLKIKLSGDEVYTNLRDMDSFASEEFLWKYADMTNQKILIHNSSILAALRFIPLSDEEVKEYQEFISRKDTRNLYVSDYIDNSMRCYANTDVEWLASECCEQYETDPNAPYYVTHRQMYQQAKEAGIKLAHSLRLGYWGGGSFPYTFGGSQGKFFDEHQDCHCIDRNGDVIHALSFAYPEVRRFRINTALEVVRCGGDAVSVMACRGVPFVLFEKPVADAFFEKYGEYPYERPLDDVELNEIHCEFITKLFRELREALDNEFGKDKIEIHLRGVKDIDDCKYIGFDVKKLASEGLLQRVITHQRRFYESVPDSILKSKNPVRIDLEKYTEYINGPDDTTHLDTDNSISFSPVPNTRGENIGCESFAQSIREWEQFAEEYGVKVYHEMSNHIFNNETALFYLKEIYSNGGKAFSIHNTACALAEPILWDLLKYAGHKDYIMNLEDHYQGEYVKHRAHTVDVSYYNRYLPIWGG